LISYFIVSDFFELIFGQRDSKVVHFKLLSLGSESDLLHEFFVHFNPSFHEELTQPLEITPKTSEILARF
jgi:hypothetical protein